MGGALGELDGLELVAGDAALLGIVTTASLRL